MWVLFINRCGLFLLEIELRWHQVSAKQDGYRIVSDKMTVKSSRLGERNSEIFFLEVARATTSGGKAD